MVLLDTENLRVLT